MKTLLGIAFALMLATFSLSTVAVAKESFRACIQSLNLTDEESEIANDLNDPFCCLKSEDARVECLKGSLERVKFLNNWVNEVVMKDIKKLADNINTSYLIQLQCLNNSSMLSLEKDLLIEDIRCFINDIHFDYYYKAVKVFNEIDNDIKECKSNLKSCKGY
jgi:hypothetical protein